MAIWVKEFHTLSGVDIEGDSSTGDNGDEVDDPVEVLPDLNELPVRAQEAKMAGGSRTVVFLLPTAALFPIRQLQGDPASIIFDEDSDNEPNWNV